MPLTATPSHCLTSVSVLSDCCWCILCCDLLIASGSAETLESFLLAFEIDQTPCFFWGINKIRWNGCFFVVLFLRQAGPPEYSENMQGTVMMSVRHLTHFSSHDIKVLSKNTSFNQSLCISTGVTSQVSYLVQVTQRPTNESLEDASSPDPPGRVKQHNKVSS